MKASSALFALILGSSSSLLQAEPEEAPAAPEVSQEDWEAAHKKAAEEKFAAWKAATGDERRKLAPEVIEHAVPADRQDLVERLLTDDRLEETKIAFDTSPTERLVTLHDLTSLKQTTNSSGWEVKPVWRRMTADRLEVWTPQEGKLFDASGKLLCTARVKRGDGWGREWYGAFLPDGQWVTTDLDELDKTLTFFSKEGKKLRSIKGNVLVPQKTGGEDDMPSIPLIAWARSNREGNAWIVWVGSEFGRGTVRVTPDGRFQVVESPWKECLPQQLGPRGMYTSKIVMSDDGKIRMTRSEPGHGMFVGWPTFAFPGSAPDDRIIVPNGYYFGILPDNRTFYVEGDDNTYGETHPASKLWFFDRTGKVTHWMSGSHVGTDLKTGELIVALSDDTTVRISADFTLGDAHSYRAQEGQLTPVELHEDLGLGFFYIGEKLALGTWEKQAK